MPGAESDLQVASLQDCAVLELRKDLTISHLSQSWQQLTGRCAAEFINKPVEAIVDGSEEDKQVFANAIAEMQNQSFRIVFPSFGGTLEAQGILTEEDVVTYSLWVVRPYQGQLGGNISEELKKKVGYSGSRVLESFFADLRAAVFENRSWYPAPRLVLCRICETFLPNWWFERHTEFCTIEHTLESRILEAHDKLVEHKVLLTQLALQGREYKGMVINRKRSPSINNQFAVRVSSPLATRRPSSTDPVAAIFNKLLAVVDLALEFTEDVDHEDVIASDESCDASGDASREPSPDDSREPTRKPSPDASREPSPFSTIDTTIKEPEPAQLDDEGLEPGSPKSNCSDSDVLSSKIKRIKHWDPPNTTQPGLKALVEDTNALIQQKADLVMRMNNYLNLTSKVLTEVEQMVAEQVEHITLEQTPSAAPSAAPSRAMSPMLEPHDEYETDDDTRSRKSGGGRGSVSSSTSLFGGLTGSSSSKVHPFLPPTFMPPRADSSSGAGPSGILKTPSTMSLQTKDFSPTSSPWQSPISSPRLGPYPIHHSRTLSRSMSVVSSSNRDRSTSIASSEESFTRQKAKPPCINDYEVISPISKGAFATVYLTRKKLTGEYFAIKCLRKSDVLEKNQATNVRAERAILITTADSPYVAKLYYTFQSREFLYMVMEYVNGGDCASLLRAVTCLSEDWSKRYVAEIIVAVDSLHQQNIIHRDLKPDNLLIDSKGHLKLSDFGLSTKSAVKKHLRIEAAEATEDSSLVGTPDYVAPETIRNEKQDEGTDWWAVGCMLFEFLYGIPPFNDETPAKIFDNIVECRIQWPELPPEHDISPAAKDLITRLLTVDSEQRLGHYGVHDIKNHAFFAEIDWQELFEQEPSFIPHIERPDQTDYFDDRGATMQNFSDEVLPAVSVTDSELGGSFEHARRVSSASSGASSRRASRLESGDEFGPFSYKNVGVLERQNHELITKLKTEADLSKPRRLSMSSPISSAGGTTNYWESAIHDSSPFASDNEDGASRSAALSRVHQRRLQRKSSSYGNSSPLSTFVPDILICVSNPVWRYSMEKMLRDVGCRVVSCASGDEAIRRGSSSVPFDLIFIDQHLSSGLQPHDIAHILQVTMNANSTTPILLMSPADPEPSSLFAGCIRVPITKEALLAVLKKHCNWQPGSRTNSTSSGMVGSGNGAGSASSGVGSGMSSGTASGTLSGTPTVPSVPNAPGDTTRDGSSEDVNSGL